MRDALRDKVLARLAAIRSGPMTDEKAQLLIADACKADPALGEAIEYMRMYWITAGHEGMDEAWRLAHGQRTKNEALDEAVAIARGVMADTGAGRRTAALQAVTHMAALGVYVSTDSVVTRLRRE